MAKLTIEPGKIARARFPPLIFERCFLTVLISEIFAPEASKSFVIFFLSSREIPPRGLTINAEPPPEISIIARSFLPSRRANFKTSSPAFELFSSGTG